MSISALKKNRQAVLDKLKQHAQTQQGGGDNRYEDDRFWRPTFDKERGVGSATVYFLPAAEGDDLPWAKVIKHAFKGPTGKWYIENSLRSINKSDPVATLNSRLWNSGVESDKNVARNQKQKLEYHTWVYIMKDPANPENEGKVKIYKFGPMIFKMLEDKMFPSFDDIEPLNPFDPWDGAPFHIRMVGKEIAGSDGRKVMVPNYEKSDFGDRAPLGTDEEIEEIYSRVTPLSEFLADSNFKSEEELKKRLFEVLGASVGSGVPVLEGELPTQEAAAPRQERKTVESVVAAASSNSDIDDSDDDVDDDLEFLKSIVNDI